MEKFDKIIRKIQNKKVKSKKQLDLDRKKFERQLKIDQKKRYEKYLIFLKSYDKEIKKIRYLTNTINKKFFKKYGCDVFREVKKPKEIYGFHYGVIMYYYINAPYANYVATKTGWDKYKDAEYPPFESKAKGVPYFELSHSGTTNSRTEKKSFFGIKYKSKIEASQGYYTIHYESGGPSGLETQANSALIGDPDNKYIFRPTKKEIMNELLDLIEYHVSRL